jgi:hypothetical protein
MNSKYGATSMSTITLRGSTQPQGEPMGVELMGAGQTVLEQPAEGTKKYLIQKVTGKYTILYLESKSVHASTILVPKRIVRRGVNKI